MVTGPNDGFLTFINLDRPTGQFDETGLSGFEFLISSQSGVFREADQYLIAGEDTQPTTSLSANLGDVSDLSGTEFAFSVQHNLVGGRNFTFSLTDVLGGTTSVLCWGENCAAGSISTQLLNGMTPILDYNGLQMQVRAQDVVGATAEVTVTSFTGVTLSGNPLFDEIVTLTSPASILNDTGRRGQWFMGDNLDLVVNEWEFAGLVTLTRPDAALTDVTKVRLAIDFVRDPNLPFLVPEPSTTVLGFTFLLALARRHAPRLH